MWKSEKGKALFLRLKKTPLLILAGLLGALLLILGTCGMWEKTETETSSETPTASETYRHALETQLTDACQAVEGVGRTKVVVTLSVGEQYLYDGSRMTGTIPPQVQGVLVVCEGGGKDTVKRELTSLISALCHITANHIHIAEMK